MKKILMLVFLLFQSLSYSDELLFLANGQKVILSDDKTWKYLKDLEKKEAYVKDKQIKGKYVGEVKEGLAHGYGISKGKDEYEGFFFKGLMHKKGRYTFKKNNTIYDGEIYYGVINGFGKAIYSNGDLYTGEWKNGKMEGKGFFTFSNGVIYEGGFKDNQFEGKGKILLENGHKFEGVFKNSLPLEKEKYDKFLETAQFKTYTMNKYIAEISEKNKEIIKVNEQFLNEFNYLANEKVISKEDFKDFGLVLHLTNEFLKKNNEIYKKLPLMKNSLGENK